MFLTSLAVTLILALSCCASAQSGASSTKKLIVSGAQWLDTDGNIINAHGGGIIRVNGTFYWVGSGVGCCDATSIYTSTDLVNWKNEGTVYNDTVSRPKLVWSDETQMWNILGQVGRQMNVASSPDILGPYTTAIEPYSPLGVNFTDFGLFLDADNNAYSLYSADHNNDVISLLSPDRQNVTTLVHQFSAAGLESPGMFKTPGGNGMYFFIASHKTAYLPNNDVVYSAPALSGPWSVQSYIAPMGTRTWNSQNTFELTINGTEGEFTMFMGDRWTYPELENSTYVWLPIKVDAQTGSVAVEWFDAWEVDVEKGTWKAVEGTKVEAETGTLVAGGKAVVASCPTCSGNKIVTGITATAPLTLTLPSTSPGNHTISFHYINTDGLFGDLTVVDADTLALTKQRNATVSVNGADSVFLAQYDTNAGIVMSVPLEVELKEGENTIVVGAVGNQTAADLDYIVIY